MRVAMIGTGYVGLVSGACFADFGHDVTCVDKDAAKIARLRDGDIPIFEPGLDRLVAANVREGRLDFTTDLPGPVAEADAVFIAVGTPSRRGDGHADLCYVHWPRARSRPRLSGFTVVVTKSTVPVGTGDEIERIIAETRPDADVAVVSNPEFLREGAAIQDFKRPDRVVVGTEDERAQEGDGRALPAALSQRGADPLHRPAHRGTDQVRRQRLPGHEDHLHQRDRRPVREGRRRRAAGRARHRPRQPHRRRSSCTPDRATAARAFPRTRWPWSRPPRTPARRCASSRPSPRSTTRASAAWRARSPRRSAATLRGKTIAVLGLTFKPNTDDMREAPSIPLITALTDMGARVRAYDPVGMDQARQLLRGSRVLPTAPMTAPRAPMRSSSSPNGTSSARSISTACSGVDEAAGAGRPAQRLPAGGNGGVSSTTASGAPLTAPPDAATIPGYDALLVYRVGCCRVSPITPGRDQSGRDESGRKPPAFPGRSRLARRARGDPIRPAACAAAVGEHFRTVAGRGRGRSHGGRPDRAVARRPHRDHDRPFALHQRQPTVSTICIGCAPSSTPSSSGSGPRSPTIRCSRCAG